MLPTAGDGPAPRRGGWVHAIALEFDAPALRRLHPSGDLRSAAAEIDQFLLDYGFERRLGTLHVGTPETSPVDCVLAVEDLVEYFGWFAPSVRTVRMLRIEDEGDMRRILERRPPPLRSQSQLAAPAAGMEGDRRTFIQPSDESGILPPEPGRGTADDRQGPLRRPRLAGRRR